MAKKKKKDVWSDLDLTLFFIKKGKATIGGLQMS
jgi:hypothetical protein